MDFVNSYEIFSFEIITKIKLQKCVGKETIIDDIFQWVFSYQLL